MADILVGTESLATSPHTIQRLVPGHIAYEPGARIGPDNCTVYSQDVIAEVVKPLAAPTHPKRPQPSIDHIVQGQHHFANRATSATNSTILSATRRFKLDFSNDHDAIIVCQMSTTL